MIRKLFPHASIGEKFRATLLIMFLATLLITFVLLIPLQVYSTVKNDTEKLEAITMVTAGNLQAAVLFEDYKSAAKTLDALRLVPAITDAVVFDQKGKLLVRGDFTITPVFFHWQEIEIIQPIMLDSRVVGTLHLHAVLTDMWINVVANLAITLSSLLLAFILAWLFARRLISSIVEPIANLARAFRLISVSKQYHLRAEKISDDEVGELVIGFNNMLNHIAEQNDELNAHRDDLEREVDIRTKDLQEAIKKEQEASQAKNQFLARISHELRTPLNAILGFAQLMETGINIEESQEFIRIILKSGWHLLSIINDLLDLTTIEANKILLYTKACNVEKTIDDCLKTLTPIIQKRHLEVIVLPAEPNLFISADDFRLKQVLLNLLTNAVKYNHENGSIKIACAKQPDSNRIRISITDTGSGISETVLPSLFEPFSRLHERAYEIEGAGIGLAIAKGLTELMGGKIGLESTVGKGSTFWVEFESTQAPATELATTNGTEETVQKQSANKIQLLYIEDNLEHIKLMEYLVHSLENVELLTANSAHLGLELADGCRPKLIFTDIGLPEMDGFGILERLQNNPNTCNIPVIAVSAHAVPVEVERGLQAGFKRYLVKPLRVDQFLQLLKELLNEEAQRAG